MLVGRLKGLIILLFVALVWADQAVADPLEEFYRGKQISHHHPGPARRQL